MNKRVLIIGPTSSVLIRQRVAMLSSMNIEPYWYSQSSQKVDGLAIYTRLTNLRILGGFLELIHVVLLLCWVRPGRVHVFYAKNRWLNLLLAMHPRLIVTVMGSDISKKTVKTGSLDFNLVKLLLRRAEVVTSKSAYMDEILNRFRIPRDKVKRVTWGIDTDKFRIGLDSSDLRQRLGISADTPVFFSLRACKPLYQHELVLRAFSLFTHSHSRAVLLVSTMGAVDSYLSQLKQLVLDLGIEDKVIFLPTIDNDEMPLFYDLVDAVISVPRSDGMPQSLYESMACGCFHILGNLPQYHEVVQPEISGLYVDMADETTLADAFHWVVENKIKLLSLAQDIRTQILPLVDRNIQKNILNDLYAGLNGQMIASKA